MMTVTIGRRELLAGPAARQSPKTSSVPTKICSDSPDVPPPLSGPIWIGTPLAGHRRRNLASPYREQPAGNAVAPRHFGDVCTLLKVLRHDPGLLLARPSSPPALPGDHLDATIGITFLPGIKHGICHCCTSTDQLVPGSIAGESRHGEVEASCRLRLNQSGPTSQLPALERKSEPR
jgi:hypothetical protein